MSGWDSLLRILQRWLPGLPSARASGMGADVLGVEMLLLDAGLLVTLYAMWRTVRASAAAPAAMLPWASLAVGLYGAGVWIFLQPMQMRGMMMMH